MNYTGIVSSLDLHKAPKARRDCFAQKLLCKSELENYIFVNACTRHRLYAEPLCGQALNLCLVANTSW